MDQATTELILKLQIQDIDDAIREQLEKSDGQQSDEGLSLVEIRRELQITLACLEDRRVAFQIGRDDQADQALVTRALEEERMAADDHELACRLAGMTLSRADKENTRDKIEGTALVLSTAHEHARVQDLDLDDTASILSFVDDGAFGGPALASSSRAKGKGRADNRVRCCVCQEPSFVFDTLELSCEPDHHTYCRECLVELFESSMTDTELFPPRCCRQPIPLESIKCFLSKDFIAHFEEKSIELSTPNPTYCSRPTCSKFISPKDIQGDIASCVACSTVTCATCKGPIHDGLCPDDPNVQALLVAAREGGWQRCNNCRNMVELTRGCNHITCRCGSEFCYVCGETWKNCPCNECDVARLYDEGYQQAARDQPRNRPPPRAVVEEAVRNLRENHECNHASWRHLSRSHGHDTACEICPRQPTTPLDFVNECRQCRLRACWRCIDNRLR